jgi:hypothetical protein
MVLVLAAPLLYFSTPYIFYVYPLSPLFYLH